MAEDGRGRLREAADQFSGEVAEFFAEMLKADKTTRASCSCGRKFDVSVPDWSARARAIEVLLSHGYGRPGQQRDEQADLVGALAKDASDLSAEERSLILEAARRQVQVPKDDVGVS
jgi:hypothetical protein